MHCDVYAPDSISQLLNKVPGEVAEVLAALDNTCAEGTVTLSELDPELDPGQEAVGLQQKHS